MGPGHLGIGLAAKPIAPKAPLWVLLVASETLDLLCFCFVAGEISCYSNRFQPGCQSAYPGLDSLVAWAIHVHLLVIAFWGNCLLCFQGLENERDDWFSGFQPLDFGLYRPPT